MAEEAPLPSDKAHNSRYSDIRERKNGARKVRTDEGQCRGNRDSKIRQGISHKDGVQEEIEKYCYSPVLRKEVFGEKSVQEIEG